MLNVSLDRLQIKLVGISNKEHINALFNEWGYVILLVNIILYFLFSNDPFELVNDFNPFCFLVICVFLNSLYELIYFLIDLINQSFICFI